MNPNITYSEEYYIELRYNFHYKIYLLIRLNNQDKMIGYREKIDKENLIKKNI